jgi:uroporphyrinogen-III synthase
VIVLVTRALTQSQALAERLKERGHETLLLPLLHIEPVAHAVLSLERTLDGAQALLFTSANGVRAFAAASPRRDLRVLAVGEQTATAAREAGFTAIETAGGDVTSLTALVTQQLAPEAGALVHAAGETVAGDLAGVLEQRGFQVRRATLYRAEAAHTIDPEAESKLRARSIDAAMFFSPRTAAIFVALIHGAKLESSLARTTALALSPAVAAALAPLPWARILTAREPTEAALMEALDLVATPETVRDSPTAMSVPEVIPPSAPAEPDPSEAASPPPAAEPRAARRGAGQGFMLAGMALALVLAGAALAGVAYTLWFEPPPSGGRAASDDRLRAIEARLGAIDSRLGTVEHTGEHTGAGSAASEARLASLEQKVTEASAASARVAEQAQSLADRVAALEQQLTKVSDAAAALDAVETASKALEAETKSLAQRLDTQSASLAALAAQEQQASGRNEAALLIGLQQLRLALAGSGPFAAPLRTVGALAHDQAELLPDLQALEPHAESGIPSLAQLTERFEPMANRVLESAPVEPDQGWLSSAGSYLMRFFDVRHERGGSDAESVLSAAQDALKLGDLKGTIAALKGLEGASAEAARAWISDAEARTDAEQRLAALDDAVRRRLLTQGAQGTAP